MAMETKWKGPSIARNLTVSLMLTVSFVTLLVTAVFTLYQFEKDKDELGETADEIVELAAQSLSLPVWFLHTDTIGEIGRAYSYNRLVVSLEINDLKGQQLYSFGKGDATAQDITRKRSIIYKGEPLGSLEISLSGSSLQAKRNRLLVLGGLVAVLVCLALLPITGACLRYFLDRPVKRLQTLVENYAGGVLDVPESPLPPLEFKRLEGTFRSMAGRIRSQVEQLAQAEARYRSLFQNALEGVYRVSLDGRLLMANPSMARILGYESPEELLASAGDVRKTLYANPDERSRFLEEMHQHGRVVDFETVFRKKDGELLNVRLGATMINVEGEIQGYCEDVTQQMQARKALIAAKEEAEAANQLKSDFLSMVSHELRTPLTSVVGFSKLIEKRLCKTVLPHAREGSGHHDAAVRQMLEQLKIIINESERLTNLINNVLDLAKLEAGSMELSFKACSIEGLFTRALATTKPLFEAQGIRSRLDVPPDLPLVSCDPDRIHQVLINLLSNAVRFTGEGEVRCSARFAQGLVTVSVLDQGQGIDPEQAHCVFEKFQQLGDTVTDTSAGTGLGLAICREIVEQHGGRIWFENGEHQGCEFSFTLHPVV